MGGGENVFNRDRQLAQTHTHTAQLDAQEQGEEKDEEEEQLSFVENRPGFSPVLSQKPTRSCQKQPKQQTKEEIHKD